MYIIPVVDSSRGMEVVSMGMKVAVVGAKITLFHNVFTSDYYTIGWGERIDPPLHRHNHPGYESLLWRILKLVSIRFTGTSLIYVWKIVFAQSLLTQLKVLGRSRNEEIFNFHVLIRFWFIKCTKTNLQPWQCTGIFIYITYEQEWPIPSHKSVSMAFMNHELKKGLENERFTISTLAPDLPSP